MRKSLPILILATILLCICLFLVLFTIPSQAERLYGPPAAWLTVSQRVQYAARLLWYNGLLTRPLDLNGGEQRFAIEMGESVNSVAVRLQEVGLIHDAESFRAYLIYSGLDTSIQAGEYRLSPVMSAINIAHEFQDATSTEVSFVILPGWRMEEIAAALPTSGLAITPEEFLSARGNLPGGYDFLSEVDSVEGYLFPDAYILPRNISVAEFVNTFVRNFGLHLTTDLRLGFEQQGLTIHEAVIIASIVEREAVRDEEKPLIASVYLNRIRIGMKLEADPTVQYSLGYDYGRNSWWKSPLSLNDLRFDSPFNTYIYAGLPPEPIANPSMDSLQAVAYPAKTDYYFFRAKCDGSNYHSFANDFEGHLLNACP